jgi:hypothetical protein
MGKLNIILRSSWKVSAINNSTKDLDPTGAPKIWKPKLRVKKLGGNDIKWSNQPLWRPN